MINSNKAQVIYTKNLQTINSHWSHLHRLHTPSDIHRSRCNPFYAIVWARLEVEIATPTYCNAPRKAHFPYVVRCCQYSNSSCDWAALVSNAYLAKLRPIDYLGF